MEKQKLTKLEKYWILYDVGNSAFVLLVSTIIPIYFNYLTGNAGVSEVDSLAYWGYAASAATIIVALIRTNSGFYCRYEKLQKTTVYGQYDGRGYWLCSFGISDILGRLFGCFCDRKSRI